MDGPHMCLGPLVWYPDNAGGKTWYFVVAGSTKEGFFVDQINTTKKEGDEMRSAFMTALVQASRKPPVRALVLHDFGDEMDMAQFNAAIWPCEKTEKILRNLRLERTQPGGSA